MRLVLELNVTCDAPNWAEVIGVGAAVAWPTAARAQQPERMKRIGVLMGYPESDSEAQTKIAAFQDGLQKLGWTEGRNIRIDTRWAAPADAESMERFAKELVAIAAPVRDRSQLDSVVSAQAREPNGGLIVMPDSFTDLHRAEITSLAARYRLPAVYPRRIFTEVGGLLSYGIDQLDNFRLAATYADRILKGEKPADLPVQAPSKYELVINLKTAKALGLDVPVQLQQRADEVIE